MMRTIALLLLLLLAALGTAVSAGNTPAGGRILMLYKTRDTYHRATIDYLTPFIQKAGYEVDTKDVEELLSRPEKDPGPCRGIVTCFLSSEMVGADRYPRFLVHQMQAGRKIVIIGTYGAYQGLIPAEGGRFVSWNESTRAIDTFFWPFGLRFLFAWTGDAKKLAVTKKDPSMVESDTPLKAENVNYYQLFQSINPGNQVYLELERKDMPDSKSAVVVQTPYGGMVMEGYSFFWDQKAQKNFNRVDFTRLFREVFSAPPPPLQPQFRIKTHDQIMKDEPLPPLSLKAPPSLPGAEKRRVLVLYKENEVEDITTHPFRKRGEMVINHLGMIADYRAIGAGLPGDREMEPYRAVITWHGRPSMKNAAAYGEWLIRQSQRGIRVIILGNYGASLDAVQQVAPPNLAKVFNALGMTWAPLKPGGALDTLPVILKKDPSMVGFERALDIRDLDYSFIYRSRDSGNRVYLSLQDRVSGRIDLVVTTPSGGVALEGSAYYYPDYDMPKMQSLKKAFSREITPEFLEEDNPGAWIVNPFLFFARALGVEDLPAPDYPTMNGNRIFYSHIDGDALVSLSLIDRAHSAGDFILNDIIRAYPALPFTASVITQEVEDDGNEFYNASVEIARRIFREPNVEVASHTATHPFDWVIGNPFITDPDSSSWKVEMSKVDQTREIWASSRFITENLAPPGKPCTTVLWTGECNPDEKALEVAMRSGLRNLNGGDPRYSKKYPTITTLCPVGRTHGAFHQYYTSGANDFIYTNSMLGDMGGMKNLVEYFNVTGSPRRLMPMNVYFHYFSGIQQVSIDALRSAIDYCLQDEITPLYASQYSDIASDFYVTCLRRGNDGWELANNGCLRTLRFNRKVTPDIEKSSGVLGYCHSQGNTYVHLDGSRNRRIVLSGAEKSFPHIVRASVLVDSGKLTGDVMGFTIRGFGRMSMDFGGCVPSKTFTATLTTPEGVKLWSRRLASSSTGVFSIRETLPAPGRCYLLMIQMGDTEDA